MTATARAQKFSPIAGTDALEDSIDRAADALLALGKSDGHWCFELEADCTIPAEYVLMRHYRDEPIDRALEGKIAVYLRRVQGAHGGWPLFQDGAFNISASVKAYFALKMIGDDVERAAYGAGARGDPRPWRRGGEQRLHARAAGALWRNPVARRAGDAGRNHAAAEMVPVPSRQGFLLGAHRARAAAGADGEEAARRRIRWACISANCSRRRRTRCASGPRARIRPVPWAAIFGAIDKLLHVVEPYFPKRTRDASIALAEQWTTERLNGVDGLGAIFPAMVNSLLMYDVLGVAARRSARRSPRARRSSACWSSRTRKPIASPASRRCGTRRSSATPCSKPAGRRPRRAPAPRSTGSRPCRFST